MVMNTKNEETEIITIKSKMLPGKVLLTYKMCTDNTFKVLASVNILPLNSDTSKTQSRY